MGKGDTYRPVDRKKWDEAWSRLSQRDPEPEDKGQCDECDAQLEEDGSCFYCETDSEE